MATVLTNLTLFGPECIIVAFLLLLFLADGLVPQARNNYVPLLLVVIGCVAGAYVTHELNVAPSTFFGGMVANDGFSAFFRYFFFFTCALSLYLTYGSRELKGNSRIEFSILLMCVTFGMSLMAIATHLLILYLGIETVSIVSFVMAGFKRDNLRSNEASFKYLVFGATASGLMLYGISLLYGFAGSLYYSDLNQYLVQHAGELPFVVMLALVFIYGGIAYKISSFPLHFWTPDVYEGSPTPVTTFFSVGPKAAGFAAILRLVLDVFTVRTGPLDWKALEGVSITHIIAVIAALTMIVGNLSALGQNNAKRMLAYSSIAHVGYALTGIVTLSGAGIAAVLFYLAAYCLMNLGAFWVITVVGDSRGNEEMEAFRGIGWTHPLLGVCMAVFLFSLTGLPLFSGFIGKFLLFGALLKTPGYLWLVILGVLNSVVSLYYYSKFLKAMWLDRPEAAAPAIVLPLYHAIPLVALAVPTILLGLFFMPLLRLAQSAVMALH